MRDKRKTVVRLIDSGTVHNHRLAEFFAKKITERNGEC